jgi:hypothetical protein
VAATSTKKTVGGKKASVYSVKVPAASKMKWSADTTLCVNLIGAELWGSAVGLLR